MLKLFRRKNRDQAPDAMQDLLTGIQLPSFPALVMEVLSDLRDPNCSLGNIAHKLEGDPGLTVQILRTVNAAAFGLSREVTNLQTAVAMTGHARLETILLTHSVRNALPPVNSPTFSVRRFWTVAAQRACLARHIAAILHPASQNEAFTAGLLQDMAVPVLVQHRQEIYAEILTAMHDPQHWLHELEHERFDFDHTDLGGHMAREWNLPSYLIEAISSHHGTEDDPTLEPGVRLAALIRDHEGHEGLAPVCEFAQQNYGLGRDRLDVVMSAALAEAEEFAQKIV